LAVAALFVRVAAGGIVAGFGVGKFTRHAAEAASFGHYGIPYSGPMTYVTGVVELAGGVALVIGFLTRLAAPALAVNFIVAIATAGRIDGGVVNLGLAPTLLVAMVFLRYAGSGRRSLDGWAVDRLSSHHPLLDDP
jgi:putative oxidoreductase